MITQLESGLNELYEQYCALYGGTRSKISIEMDQVDCVEIDPSDSVSQVELCSTASSSTLVRRIELRRKRVRAEALRGPELAKAAAAEAKAWFGIEQANLPAEKELLSERGSIWFLVCLVPANTV